jgi:protein gp37
VGKVTKIQWADSTLGLSMGCSSSCELGSHCFAERWCKRLAGRKGYPKDFHKPELFLHRLDALRKWPDLTGTKRPGKPWLDGKPRLVFLNDLGETFDPALEPDWLRLLHKWTWTTERMSVLEILAKSLHTYIILTKHPETMYQSMKGYSWPPNVWPGVSITTQETADERVEWLTKINAAVRIVSHEPALGPVDWSPWLFPDYDMPGSPVGEHPKSKPEIDWLISGPETGPGARRCDNAWLRSDQAQAQAAGILWFLKKVPAGDEALWPDLHGCRHVPKKGGGDETA